MEWKLLLGGSVLCCALLCEEIADSERAVCGCWDCGFGAAVVRGDFFLVKRQDVASAQIWDELLVELRIEGISN